MSNAAIEVKDLVKNYGSGASETKVLRGINFTVPSGELVLIFGPSGAGKSTLLNIINGLEIPTSGEVIIDGVNITRFDDAAKATFHQQKIGMVFQAYNLIPSLSVLQNITLPMLFARMSKIEREKRALDLLKAFELSELAHRLPSEISGGQQQRVGIMRALVGNPPMIIADEPTGNLDSVATKSVMDLFRNLNRKYQNTLVIVTHDHSLFHYADRIIFILDGKVVKQTVQKAPHARKAAGDSAYRTALLKSTSSDRKILRTLDFILPDAVLDNLSSNELRQIVTLLKARLQGAISHPELYHRLDLPTDKGGAGLYQPTARHIADNIENMLELLQ